MASKKQMPDNKGTESTATPETPLDAEGIRGLDELASAFLTLREPEEVRRFLRDLCTHGELAAMAHRWQIARLLEGGHSYLEIADLADASTTTVTRVAQWLHYGAGGYRLALGRTSSKPATDESGGG
jgi:TrpR-related protein YerC/YecD